MKNAVSPYGIDNIIDQLSDGLIDDYFVHNHVLTPKESDIHVRFTVETYNSNKNLLEVSYWTLEDMIGYQSTEKYNLTFEKNNGWKLSDMKNDEQAVLNLTKSDIDELGNDYVETFTEDGVEYMAYETKSDIVVRRISDGEIIYDTQWENSYH